MWFWGIVGGLVAVHAGFWLTAFRRMAAKTPKLLEEARAMGFATTEEEYKALIFVPEGDNAFPIYEEMAKHFREVERSDPEAIQKLREVRLFEGPSAEFLTTHLPKFGPIVSQMQEASEYVAFRYSKDDGYQTVLEEIHKPLKNIYKLAVIYAEQYALQGRFEDALDILESLSKNFRQGLPEPTLMAWTLSVAHQAYWLQGLALVVKRGNEIPGVLDRAEKLLKALPPLIPLRQAMRGEVYFLQKTEAQCLQEGFAAFFEYKFRFPLTTSFFQSETAVRAYFAASISNLVYTMQSLPAGDSDPLVTAKPFEPDWFSGHWWIYPTEAMNAKRQNFASALFVHDSRLRLLHAGIDLYRYKLQNGHFPMNLPGELATSGSSRYIPLQYKREGEGFKLTAGGFPL